MESLIVNKLEAAKRQLLTAIDLYFSHGDPVSIHMLSSCAYDVIRDVNNHRRPHDPMFVKQQFPSIPGKPTRVAINEAQNFFKHAKEDPDGELEFYPLLSEPFIFDASITYLKLSGEHVPRLLVFCVWFSALKVDDCYLPEVFSGLRRIAFEMRQKNQREEFLKVFLPVVGEWTHAAKELAALSPAP